MRASPRLRGVLFVAAMSFFGGLCGLLIWSIADGADFSRWLGAGAPVTGAGAAKFWRSFIPGMVFAPVLWGSVLGARWVLLRRVPLTSVRAGAVHVGALVVVTAAALAVLLVLDQAVCVWLGVEDEGAKPTAAILVVSSGVTAFVAALYYLNDFYRRARSAEAAALEAQFAALRAQINPHFLFNTLNTIAALARSSPTDAEATTVRLANLFRYTLRASGHPAVPLAEEIEAVRLYASIELARFRERLQIEIDVPEALLDAEVPSLILQPLVENAVKHGVAQSEGPCLVRLRVSEERGTVVAEVRDTGPGFSTLDAAAVLARGTGLRNVRDRLRLRFGAAGQLDLLPDGVRLGFPLRVRAAAVR